MKWNMYVGALVLSLGLCSQSFGFELLDRMLGVNRGGCCETSCCEEQSCCEAEPTCCEEEVSCCEPEPSCCEPDPCCKKRHDLFGGLKGLFSHKKNCCQPACEPTCCEEEVSCCEAEPTCCDVAPSCCSKKKKHCGLFSNLFKSRKSCKTSCCESACNTGCDSGCNSCGGGDHGSAPAPASVGEEAAPLPPAPMADPSASIQGSRRVMTASRTYVRN